MMNRSQLFGYVLTIFGLGVLIGMLYAPRKGSESREILVDKMQDYYKQSCSFVKEKAKELKDNIDELA